MTLKELTLYRNSSETSHQNQILRSNYIRSSSSSSSSSQSPLKSSHYDHYKTSSWSLISIVQSILNFISFNPIKLITPKINNFTIITTTTRTATCRWLSLSIAPESAVLGRKVTGTLFGTKKGHLSFAVQEHPRADPVLLLELATTTCALVKEMAASGLVRIALECEKRSATAPVRLHEEARWSMYCSGRRRPGFAMRRECGERDWHVLSTLQTVTVGAGVIPAAAAEEEVNVMYMRARLERVAGGRDSEAYYMMHPDRMGGPDLSIFFIRI